MWFNLHRFWIVFSLKAIFSEIGVRICVQAVSCQKALLWLADQAGLPIRWFVVWQETAWTHVLTTQDLRKNSLYLPFLWGILEQIVTHIYVALFFSYLEYCEVLLSWDDSNSSCRVLFNYSMNDTINHFFPKVNQEKKRKSYICK